MVLILCYDFQHFRFKPFPISGIIVPVAGTVHCDYVSTGAMIFSSPLALACKTKWKAFMHLIPVEQHHCLCIKMPLLICCFKFIVNTMLTAMPIKILKFIKTIIINVMEQLSLESLSLPPSQPQPPPSPSSLLLLQKHMSWLWHKISLEKKKEKKKKNVNLFIRFELSKILGGR